jgi:hypothetical protein
MRHCTSVAYADVFSIRLRIYATEFFKTLVRNAHDGSIRSRCIRVQGAECSNSEHCLIGEPIV